jgi:membrane fusion protein, multidrug efflux system
MDQPSHGRLSILRSKQRWRSGLSRGFAIAAVALGMLGMLAGGTAILQIRAVEDAPVVETPPIPVDTIRIRRTDGYRVEERFVGRLEPARQTELAFERAGLVMEVLVEEGDRIVSGALVARLDTAALEASRERLEAERRALLADLELAQLTEARQRDLSAKGHSSVQRYDEARLATRALEARIAQTDAAIVSVDIDLRKSELKAPFGGTIAGRFGDEGAVVDVGAPLVHLLESDRPQVRIGLSPEAAAVIEQQGTYTLRAGHKELRATLMAVRADLATGTRTVPALFEVKDGQGVRFGDVVELVVHRQVSAKGFWSPRTALIEGRKGLWDVLTVVQSPRGAVIEREAVEVLHSNGDQVFVRGTLAETAEVVAGGAHRVIPGQRVEVMTSGARS